MARHIAIEWDDGEARLVIAHCRGGNVRIEHALTAALPSGASQATPQQIGEVLARLLAETGITRGEAIVVIGRASIELRRMKLPPAPPEELPDIARFQAVREFTNYGDDWALDYELLSGSNDEATWVLAAVLSPQMMKFSRQVAEAAGLGMGHLLLRPFAAASLFESSSLGGAEKAPLLIDMAAGEADLTALAENRVIFTRTVKLSGDGHDADAFSAELTREIRRTLVAAQNQQAGYKVDQIVLCDDRRGGSAIGQQIQSQLGMPVHVLDPFDVVDASALREKPPGVGRFASLIGALLEESREERHAIDFLDPKRRPPPPDRRRAQLLAAAAAGLLAVAVAGGLWWTLSSLDRQIAEHTATIKGNKLLLERFAAKQKEVDALNQFLLGDIVWLDELKRISTAAPPPNEAIVTTFRSNIQPNDTGKIALEGVISDASLIEDFESRMRDEAHRVAGKGGSFDERGELPWKFNETITIDPNKLETTEQVTEPAAADPKAADTSETPAAKAGEA